MTITCTKDEFAEMLGRCVKNANGNDFNACTKCALYDRCDGAYIDTLTKIIKIEEVPA